MSIEAMRQAMEALELFVKYENPNARIQVRKPKDGGPMVTIYPKRVAAEAATALRQAIAQAEQAQPVAHSLMCVCGAVWDIKPDGGEEMVHTPDVTPPRKPWVGLTGDEVNEFAAGCHLGNSVQGAIRKAEATIKEKNT